MELQSRLEAARTGYREDFVAWVDEQAALLKSGRLAEVDLLHVIEEIEGLGSSQRAALASQIERIVEHLLKLIYSTAEESRRGWRESVRNARSEIEKLIDDSPSLNREIGYMVIRAVPRASRSVARNLADYGEIDLAGEAKVQRHSFTVDQVLGDWFPDA